MSDITTRPGTPSHTTKEEVGNEVTALAASLSEDQVAEFKECFSLFDQDGGGTVDVSEMGQVMKSLGANMSDVQLKEMIDEVDADQSGEIEFAEFLALMAKQVKDAESNKLVRQVFKLFDTGNNGSVQVADVRFVLTNLCGDKLSSEEIDDLLVKARLDASERLDWEAFVTLFEN